VSINNYFSFVFMVDSIVAMSQYLVSRILLLAALLYTSRNLSPSKSIAVMKLESYGLVNLMQSKLLITMELLCTVRVWSSALESHTCKRFLFSM
jgi:hypothetical protein